VYIDDIFVFTKELNGKIILKEPYVRIWMPTIKEGLFGEVPLEYFTLYP